MQERREKDENVSVRQAVEYCQVLSRYPWLAISSGLQQT